MNFFILFFYLLCYTNIGGYMNKNIDKNNLNDVITISKKILKLVYIFLIVVGTYIILKIFKELKLINIVSNILKILSPLFIGIIIAWLLNPLVRWLESKKIRRSIGASMAYIILIGIIFLIVKSIIPILYNQILDLVGNIPNIFLDIKNWALGIFDNIKSNSFDFTNIRANILDGIDKTSTNLSTKIPTMTLNFITGAISSIGTFLIGLVIGFFLLLSCDNLSKNLLEIVPKKIRKNTSELSKRINQSLRNYVSGALIDTFVVFVVSTIVFAIIGLKAPVLFGLFCGLTNVIPYAGPYIGGAPAVIVGFSQSTGVGIAILIAIILIQTIEGNVLQTLIISKTTKLNPVTIILGLLLFGYFFGIIGMLLSTPIIGVFKVILQYFDEKYDLLNFN